MPCAANWERSAGVCGTEGDGEAAEDGVGADGDKRHVERGEARAKGTLRRRGASLHGLACTASSGARDSVGDSVGDSVRWDASAES